MAEQSADRKQLVFSGFNPMKGRGPEASRFDIGPNTNPAGFLPEIRAPYVWGLSPDGTRVAALKRSGAQIYILSLDSRAVREIAVKGWNNFQALDWAVDGKGLFASSSTPQGAALLYVDLRGSARVLWQQRGWTGTGGVPSPDGRHLAMVAFANDSNVWMIENF